MATATAEAPKELKMTQAQLDELIAERFQKMLMEMGLNAMRQAQGGSGPQVYKTPQTILEGEIIPPGWVPPDGYQAIVYRDGTMRAHRRGKANFDQDITTRTLNKVTEAFKAWMTPTKDNPKPVAPKRLLINSEWRKLFKSVKTWGDHTDIEKVADDRFKDKDGKVLTGPQFKFVESETDEPAKE